MSLSEFGPFASAFEKGELPVPGYLELLLLRATAHPVIDRIKCSLAEDDPRPWVAALLADVNWRPHLVGALALLLDDGDRLDPAPLWAAMDAGSWVIPQLTVTAYVVDAQFPERLRERVAKGCPIAPPAGLSPIERHSATGPGGAVNRSAKLMASLLTVGAWVPSLQKAIEVVRGSQGVAELLTHDIDDAPTIVEQWRANLVRHFSHRGRTLKPKTV